MNRREIQIDVYVTPPKPLNRITPVAWKDWMNANTLPGRPDSSAMRSLPPLMIISAVYWSHFWSFNFELPASKKKKKQASFPDTTASTLLIAMSFFFTRSLSPCLSPSVSLTLCRCPSRLLLYNFVLRKTHISLDFSTNFTGYLRVGPITRSQMMLGSVSET